MELWSSDGTGPGTSMFMDLNTSAPGATSTPHRFGVINGSLYFFADDGIHGIELWVTTGQQAWTRMLMDWNPGPEGSVASLAVL